MGEKKSLLILNYHHVSDGTGPESLLTVHENTLLEQFEVFQKSGVRFCDLKKCDAHEQLSNFTAAITVDDGDSSGFTKMLPLLQKHQLPASFFPISGKINSPGQMTWSELRELQALGYEIGSHGISHDILTRLPVEKQVEELTLSKKILEDNLGETVTSFAFPYGRYDNDLLERSINAGYKHVYSTGLKINVLESPSFLLFRWNITNKTTPEMLDQVLNSNGLLSPAINVHTRLNSFAKRLMSNL